MDTKDIFEKKSKITPQDCDLFERRRKHIKNMCFQASLELGKYFVQPNGFKDTSENGIHNWKEGKEFLEWNKTKKTSDVYYSKWVNWLTKIENQLWVEFLLKLEYFQNEFNKKETEFTVITLHLLFSNMKDLVCLLDQVYDALISMVIQPRLFTRKNVYTFSYTLLEEEGKKGIEMDDQRKPFIRSMVQTLKEFVVDANDPSDHKRKMLSANDYVQVVFSYKEPKEKSNEYLKKQIESLGQEMIDFGKGNNNLKARTKILHLLFDIEQTLDLI